MNLFKERIPLGIACGSTFTLFVLFWSIIAVPISNAGETSRISIQNVNRFTPHQITLSPGLVSLLEFPEAIIEVRVGDPKGLKALISQVSPKELTLYLDSSHSSSTNLIVRSGKRVFIFDIVASKVTHQDYLKVGFGFSSNPERVPSKTAAKRILKPLMKIEAGL